MERKDFRFDLPSELIAQEPLADRSASRLLLLDGSSGACRHTAFRDLGAELRPGDLLVFNDTRVLPARLFGHKDTGGEVEVLVERVLAGGEILAQVRASKRPRAGSEILFDEGRIRVGVQGEQEGFLRLKFPETCGVEAVLERIGHMPLPPYIRRGDTERDRERYQTVFARRPGAVAAPTAGLHFTPDLLSELQAAGIEQIFVTLHVGAGTFQPMRVDRLEEHRMHRERFEVDAEAAAAIAACRERGGRVIAVGTTVVRTLESAAMGAGRVQPALMETDIFIHPGHRFRVVDAMITNFHLPESTLLMLVAAFAGLDHTLAAYQQAVAARYRFFSYGDAMLVWPHPSALEPRG